MPLEIERLGVALEAESSCRLPCPGGSKLVRRRRGADGLSEVSAFELQSVVDDSLDAEIVARRMKKIALFREHAALFEAVVKRQKLT